MLYINPQDFVLALSDISRRQAVRRIIRSAVHCRLEADDAVALHNHLSRRMTFGEVGVTRRVIYLRAHSGRLTVRELIDGSLTTAYDVESGLSIRDLGMELAVIDGSISMIELQDANTKLGIINAIAKGVHA